jgi:GNAT superfamily N-acetyltransferase
MAITYRWRGEFSNAEINELHANGFGQSPAEVDWWGRVNRHSLGWVCGRDAGALVGFVNVAWDGGIHTFLLDTVVDLRVRRHGVGTALIVMAVRECRAAGCRWLHVDFTDQLRAFYLDACGFEPTAAGLIAL